MEDKNRNGFRKLLAGSGGHLLVALFSVCLYCFFQNYEKIMAVVRRVGGVLSPLFWAIAIAFVVNMPMRFLENRVFVRWKGKALKRGVCLTIGFLFVSAVISLVMVMIVPRFVSSAEGIIGNMDSYIVSLGAWGSELSERFNLSNSDIKRMESMLQSIYDYLDAMLERVVPMALKVTMGIASGVVDGLLALIMSFYALYNKEQHIEQARRLVRALFSDRRCKRIFDVCSQANRALNSYFFGMVLECGILGGVCFLGMTIFKFPYALLISVMVGITQIVPIIGPWCSAILGALIIMMSDPGKVVWFLTFIVIVQQLEGNLVYPRVVGNMVGLSGIWVMIAVLLGGGLFGVSGIILCVPVMAVLQTLVREWVGTRIREKESMSDKEKAAESASPALQTCESVQAESGRELLTRRLHEKPRRRKKK